MLEEPASDREYSISELEEATGTSRRTIHYYIARDLLPPADGSGLGARYREVHVLRLRAIEVLKKLGLKLEYIRAALDSMTSAQLRETFVSAEKHPSKVAYLLQRRMADRTLTQFTREVREGTLEDNEAGPGSLMNQLMRAGPPDVGSDPEPSEVVRKLGASAPEEDFSSTQHSLEDATTWRRMEVTPDLEIHYRPGRDSRFTTKLKAVVRIIREMFVGDDPAAPGAGKKK